MLHLKNKTILITGGSGSFGQSFVEYLLKHNLPKVIRIYSRDEHKQLDMAEKFSKHAKKLRFLLGDVRDKERLQRASSGVDYIIHAAALKHISSGEYNPSEVIKTNIIGSLNVIDVALDQKVEKTILISSDKACSPVSLYGASKLCAEKLFIDANFYGGATKTNFCVIRCGNFLGSRGSVIPIFLEQKNSNTLTITHRESTRFWISIENLSKFTLKCLQITKGGEIFIPKLPSIKIDDLAKVIAPSAKYKVIGLRPAEKLHEILISEDESPYVNETKDYYLINLLGIKEKTYNPNPSKTKRFTYASNLQNPLSLKEISKLIKKSVSF